MHTLGIGFVGGCAASTRCRGRESRGSLTTTGIGRLDWSGWDPAPTTFRGRRHETLSESRMRTTCMSGSTSGMWQRDDGPLGEVGSERRRLLSAPPVLYVTAPPFDSTEPAACKRDLRAIGGGNRPAAS